MCKLKMKSEFTQGHARWQKDCPIIFIKRKEFYRLGLNFGWPADQKPMKMKRGVLQWTKIQIVHWLLNDDLLALVAQTGTIKIAIAVQLLLYPCNSLPWDLINAALMFNPVWTHLFFLIYCVEALCIASLCMYTSHYI